MRKELLIIAACLIVTTVALGSGGVITDEPNAAPEFSVDFERSEEEIAAEEVLILPGYTAPADPKVKNNGKHDAHVFIKVDVPVLISTYLELEKDVQIRFDGYVPVMGFEVEEPWTLIEEEIKSGVLSQVYCYGELTPLKVGEETPPLFSSWSVINCRVVGEKSGATEWKRIEKLCPQTAITVYSIQTGIGSSVTEIWQMTR